MKLTIVLKNGSTKLIHFFVSFAFCSFVTGKKILLNNIRFNNQMKILIIFLTLYIENNHWEFFAKTYE
jgi:hypothetical protein